MLTEHELARLIVNLIGKLPSDAIIEELNRRLEQDPETLANIVRRLLAADPSRAVAALEYLVEERPPTTIQATGAAHTFRRNGDYWEIAYGGRMVLVRHAKGLAYLAQLLGRAGERIRATDLAGRTDAGARNAELARLSVTKAIKAAIGCLAAVHADLGEHLAATIRRGSSCIYLPDPHRPIRWLT